jgi:hypothetical protein
VKLILERIALRRIESFSDRKSFGWLRQMKAPNMFLIFSSGSIVVEEEA